MSVAAAGHAVALPTIPDNSTFEVGGSLSAVGSAVFKNTTGIDFGQKNPNGTFTFGTAGGYAELGGTGSAFYRNLGGNNAGFTAGTEGSATDIPAGTFNGITADGLNPKAVSFTPLYAFTKNGLTLSFDLTEIVDVVRVGSNAGTGTQTVIIDGTGVVHLTGYEDAMATFSLTATRTGTGITTTFSSSVTGNATDVQVPEPASLALLGAGLFGLGVIGRRKSA